MAFNALKAENGMYAKAADKSVDRIFDLTEKISDAHLTNGHLAHHAAHAKQEHNMEFKHVEIVVMEKSNFEELMKIRGEKNDA